MLVFVITNELFDSHLAEHFRKLAIDKDKGKEMILVVNKMERTANGNTQYQQNIIKEDLEKVLSPFTTEELNLCFLDAESYFQSLEERDLDSKMVIIWALSIGLIILCGFSTPAGKFSTKKSGCSVLPTSW